jgi:uncharacterized protein with LGFP repeats
MTVEAPERRPRAVALVERLAGALDARSSRRGFLSRVAVVGSALAVGPGRYLLRPGTAYANVCGIDSTCSSGYTVFCATINGGVNRCPPNALVGGWWKADNSGFCCGSARYYIDCHSYCSCGCGGGARYCGEGCRSCSCGCGPASSCDQRRVCCNNFRYGQCMQHVTCTGPVWCRVVTCTPPWRVPAWSCTSTPATDNRTGSHTAPGLPNCTDIDRKHTALGGPGGILGEAQTGELGTPDGVGRYTHYDGGSIYWTPSTGANAVWGDIRAKWAALGWERSPVGYPTTDETGTGDGVGRFNHFNGSGGASIYWTPQTGAQAVWGDIRKKWQELGWERGPLGYPTTDEGMTVGRVGRYNHFNGSGGASIYWTPQTGAHAVWGDIRRLYQQLDWERGPLGYPITSETVAPDGHGRYNHFNGSGGASVYWTPQTGAHAVFGVIRTKWRELGGERGPLGYPTTSQRPTPAGGGLYNHFAGSGGGSIYWTAATGAHAVWGDIRKKWHALGAELGPLGFPVNSESSTATGRGRFNDFVGEGTVSAPAASVYWSLRTGAFSVRGPIRAEWLSRGGAEGELGFPISEPATDTQGRVRQVFERGTLLHDPATGTTTVQPS